MLVPRWLLIVTFAMLVGVSGLAVVFAQQQRAPRLSVHAIDFEYDPASPSREARFVAVLHHPRYGYLVPGLSN